MSQISAFEITARNGVAVMQPWGNGFAVISHQAAEATTTVSLVGVRVAAECPFDPYIKSIWIAPKLGTPLRNICEWDVGTES